MLALQLFADDFRTSSDAALAESLHTQTAGAMHADRVLAIQTDAKEKNAAVDAEFARRLGEMEKRRDSTMTDGLDAELYVLLTSESSLAATYSHFESAASLFLKSSCHRLHQLLTPDLVDSIPRSTRILSRSSYSIALILALTLSPLISIYSNSHLRLSYLLLPSYILKHTAIVMVMATVHQVDVCISLLARDTLIFPDSTITTAPMYYLSLPDNPRWFIDTHCLRILDSARKYLIWPGDGRPNNP